MALNTERLLSARLRYSKDYLSRRAKLVGDHLSMETKFLGTICPWGPNWLGTVCPEGPINWGPIVGDHCPGTICVWDQMCHSLSCYTARLWFHLAGLRYLYNKSVRLEQKLCTGRYSASLQWAVKPDYYQLQIFDLGIISKITHLLLRLSGRTHLTLISLMTSFQTNKLKGPVQSAFCI